MDIHDNHVNTLIEFHRRILLFDPPKNPYPPCKTMNEGIIRTWLSMGGLLAVLVDRPPMDNHVRMALRSWFSMGGRDFLRRTPLP